jgi:hypothetical protein
LASPVIHLATMQIIPGLSVLIALMGILFLFLWRLDASRISRLLEGRGFLLIVTLIISGLLMVANLFRQEAWTADVLKVLVGVVVGLGASMTGKKESNGSAVSASKSTFGDNAKIAGRDINETIERMETTVNQIRDSVIQAKASLPVSSLMNRDEEYLINTIYERGLERACDAAQKVTRYWLARGWSLRSLTSDYQGMDGLILLFARPAELNSEPGTFQYFHGSSVDEASGTNYS